MSTRPSEKENVPFTQSPSSPQKLLDAFQLSPRPPRSPQRSTKYSPRPPVSPRSSPNRSRGHLRSTFNIQPPSLLTKTRAHRVSFAQRDSHHLYTTPLRALPSYSSRPPAFVAARSILKSRTPERVVVLDLDEAASLVPKLHKREMSPVPDDPLHCATYLSSPVSTIVTSVAVAPSPNRIDGDVVGIYGPLPMTLHDLAEAYALLLARLRLQAMTIGPDGAATETEITPDLPLLQPIQQYHSELAAALARDSARALLKPISFTAPTPYQLSDIDEWSSDYSSDVYGSSSPPSSPSGPTQKRGLTAAEVKYARDLSLVSQSAIRVLAVVFHEPAVSSHFTDDELVNMLKVLISIPNTMPLPTPNPRKTHTAALWALQMTRLPLSIMHSPGVADSLFVALQMAVQGKLGREGKKGSMSEGLTAVQLLTSHYPSIFGPMLPILMSDLVKCLASPMPVIRQRAALALGGIVQGLFDWEEEEEVSAADSKKPLDLSAVHQARKDISEAIVDTFNLEKNAKNAMILKNIKDILGQFSPESPASAGRVGDTPHWAFSVLASLVTLVERNFVACHALHTSVVTCARIALNAKKASIRAAGGLLWGCVVWAWRRYDAHDESRGESQDSLMNEKIMAQVVVENIGIGVISSLLETKGRSEAVAARRLRRACRCMRTMVEERCSRAPELLGRLLSTEESPDTSAITSMAIDRKLVPTGLLTQQLAGTDMKALAIAVNSSVSQGVGPGEVRPLTMDERVAEWPQLFTTWKHFPGWVPTTDAGEPAEVLLQTWRALLLATTNVQDHIPCFLAIAEALTAFVNSKHDDPKQTALTLTFVRRLWVIVHEVFFNPLSSNTLLADFSADLIQTLAQRPPELGKKVIREAWVTLLAEVLASGTMDSTETLCDVLPESLWGSVYAGVVNKYAEDPNFEGGLVLCSVPFNENYAWVLSEDDWNAWSSLAHALVVNEGEQVFSNLLTMIGTGQTIPIPSTLRPLSILLSFSELPVSESDGVFFNLLSMANDRLRAEYSSCLSPETLEAVLDLISALRGIITPDAMSLEVIESVQTGMQLWIEDEQFALSDQEFNDGPVLFYAHAMQGLTAVPDELLDLGKLAPFLASAFTRIPAPGAGPLAFSLFWSQKFAARGPPEGGYPEMLKPCLRGILNIGELVEAGISLGTDTGEETQPKDLPAPDTTGNANAGTTGDTTSAKSTEQPDASSGAANTSVESVEMADATTEPVDTSAEEETVESSVEEIDELLDDSDVVEETILYQPPNLPGSASTPVPARASTPVPGPTRSDVRPQTESQCVPDSQAEATDSVVADARAELVTAAICESPRKRKSEDALLPSKRPKGLFIADPEIEALPILKFPARSRSSSPSSVIEESFFYSPEKYNIPPPAWSPTGIPQRLPAFPNAKSTGTAADESAEISLSEIIETSVDHESAETSVDDFGNTSIDDLPDNDLNDLPDITMSLPTRKKRMTLVVEVPRISDVLKRWSSDSASRSASATTPQKEKPGMPERVRRTRSWSNLPQMADIPPAFESTPSRRPLKRRRSERDSPGDQSVELGRSRKNSRASTVLGDLTITPKQLLATDMFDGASPDNTPSLRRVRSMPLSAKKAAIGSVGRTVSVANSRARTDSTSGSSKNVPNVAQAESSTSTDGADTAATATSTVATGSDTSKLSTTEPITRTASLEALMVDAEALAELDVAELMRQAEMLAAMREQIARALAMKRAGSVVSNAA
ncbi:hypothetical protein FRC10_006351 [Ceratobasidium sp. 414]|nr:hypothetical protein FRC10_006351 [Ceratobasidium sp. 414]